MRRRTHEWGVVKVSLDPARYENLARRVAALHDQGKDVYGAITWDDMGDNERVFVRPSLFREIYFPRYQATTRALHERGMHFFHY